MDFVKIAQFNSRLQAETVGNALEPHGIPHMVKLADAGGMIVPVLPGASLWVPADRAVEARHLLSGIGVETPGDTDGEE